MTIAASPKADFLLQGDAWLASILGLSAARLSLLNDDPADPADAASIRQAVEQRVWDDNSPARSHRDCFVDAKVDTTRVDQISILASAGLHVVDVNVTSECDVAVAARLLNSGTQADHVADRGAAPCEVRLVDSLERATSTQVLSIAERAFRFSRFHLDPKLDNTLADRIKREWVGNSIAGRRGDCAWIAIADNCVIGFLTSVLISTESDEAHNSVAVIDLIAVDPNAQGRGAGRALTRAFIEHYVAKAQRLRVGTQVANLPALRLYQSMGFQPVASTYVLHGHFSSP